MWRILLAVFAASSIGVMAQKSVSYNITQTWDSQPVTHAPIQMTLTGLTDGVEISVKAPFFNDSQIPDGQAGQPFWQLWNYEVAEAFFLGDNTRYLEVELSPFGEHLLLFLNGVHNCVKAMLPLEYTAEYHEESGSLVWTGVAKIPASYFPPRVNKFNAYHIHGMYPDDRKYMALYPVPYGQYDQPDFHRLEYFQSIAFADLLPSNDDPTPSTDWQNAMDNPSCPS